MYPVFHRTPIKALVSRHQRSSSRELETLFTDIESEAPCLSPKSILTLLQVPGRLVLVNETAAVTFRSKLGKRRQPDGVIEALVSQLLRDFRDAITPNSASKRMIEKKLTPKEIALAAWSMGRLEYSQDELMKLLCAMIQGCLIHAVAPTTSIDIANMLWACSKTRFLNHEFIGAMVEETVSRLDCFDAHSLSSVFVALGQIGVGNPLEKFDKGLMLKKLTLFDARRLSNFLWTCARLQWRDPTVLSRVSFLVLEQLDEFNSFQHLSTVFWSCGQLLLHDFPLLNGIADQLLKIKAEDSATDTFDPQGIANVFWALGRLQWRERKEFLTFLSDLTVNLANYFSPQQLSNVLWACGRLELSSESLVLKLSEELRWLLPQCSNQNISSSYWGLSRCGWESKQTRNALLPTTSGGEVIDTLVQKIESFSCQAIANLLSSCVRLNWKHSAIITALANRAQSLYNDLLLDGTSLDEADSSPLVETDETPSPYSPSGSYSQKSTQTEERVSNQCTTQHVTTTCWAFGNLLRDRHVASADREALSQTVINLFSSIACLLLQDKRSVILCTRVTHAEPRPRFYFTEETNNRFHSRPICDSSSPVRPAEAPLLERMQLQQLSLILWGFAAARLFHGSLFQRVTNIVTDRLEKDSRPSSLIALSQLLWAYGRTYFFDVRFLRGLFEVVLDDPSLLDQLAPPTISNLLWGFAVLTRAQPTSESEETVAKGGIACSPIKASSQPSRKCSDNIDNQEELRVHFVELCHRAIQRLEVSKLTPCDAGQVFTALTLATKLLTEDSFIRTSIETFKSSCKGYLQSIAPRISELHSHAQSLIIQEALLSTSTKNPKSTITIRRNSSSLFKDFSAIKFQNEVVFEETQQSCDILMTLIKANGQQHKVAIEVDGPWHYVRHIPISTAAKYMISLDGRTRLKKRLLQLEGIHQLSFSFCKLVGPDGGKSYFRKKVSDFLQKLS